VRGDADIYRGWLLTTLLPQPRHSPRERDLIPASRFAGYGGIGVGVGVWCGCWRSLGIAGVGVVWA